MKDIIVYLNQNNGLFSLIFSGLVTISTIVYAILTWKLVSETKKMREVQTEPKIEITLKSIDEAIHIQRLHIKNIGLGPAFDIQFKPKVITGGIGAEKLINEFTKTNFFTAGISYLSPNNERFSHYTDISKNYDEKTSSIISFEITYKSATKRKYSEVIDIDMSETKGSYQLGKHHLYAIADSLEKIQKDINHITSGHKKLQTDIYTNTDRIRKIEEMRAQVARMNDKPEA